MIDNGEVKYDQLCLLNVKTESGFVGDIAQDVVTEPAQKSVRIQGSKGFLEWFVNVDSGHDAIRYWDGQTDIKTENLAKTRPDDFKGEIDHIGKILNGSFTGDSPISMERGLNTMLLVAAAHASHQHGRVVKINYEKGYRLDAIEIL